MLADVRFADRAQQGVGEGVQTAVRVGMPDQALVVADPDAAEPDLVARPEPVGVEALADAGDAGLARQGFGHGEILRIGELHQHGIAGDRDNAAADPLHRRGVVGRRNLVVPGGIGFEQTAEAERLGRLHPEKAVARDRGQGAALGLALEGVGDRQNRNGPFRRRQGFDQRRDVPSRHEGPRRVVDQHRVRRVARQGLQAGHHRLRPRGPAGDDADPRQAGELGARPVLLAGRSGHNDQIGPRRKQPLGRPEQHAAPSQKAPLLGRTRARAAS